MSSQNLKASMHNTCSIPDVASVKGPMLRSCSWCKHPGHLHTQNMKHSIIHYFSLIRNTPVRASPGPNF